MTLGPGTVIADRYEMVRLLGQGGMGSVYEVRHTGTRKRMALKVITADVNMHPALVARFKVEARASGAIESQHIAQVFDVGHDEGLKVPYMAMEFLVGEDLEQLLTRVGPLPPDLALRIIAQACAGLEKAHEADVVHRDLKPANIYVCRREGEEIVIKLLDFGIAKILQEQDKEASNPSLTRTGSLIGSPLYMSPEQARGRRGGIDQRTDIWSIGIVLYQILCGRTPHQDQDAMGDLIIAICSEPARSVQEFAPWVSPEVADIIRKALEIEIEARYQTIGEMLADIRGLLPAGTAISRDMLGSLDEATKSQVAPRLSPSRAGSAGDGMLKLSTGPGGHKSTRPGAMVPPPPPPSGAASTSAAVTLGTSSTPPPKAGRSPLLIGGLAAVVVAGAVAGVTLFGNKGPTPEPRPAAAPSPTPEPTQAAPPPAEPPVPPPVVTSSEPVVTPSGTAPAVSAAPLVSPPRPPPPRPNTAAPPPPPPTAAPTGKKNPLDVNIK